MRSDARGLISVVVSLAVAVVLGLVIAQWRDATAQRPQPVNVLAEAR